MKTFICFVSLIVSSPVLAATQPVDNYGYAAIATGEYTLAENRLVERLSVAPSDQPALINLGHIYRHTNRLAQANSVYVRVLARSNVRLMATDGSIVWSHDVARAQLGGTVELALR